jgi:hypothetical protein
MKLTTTEKELLIARNMESVIYNLVNYGESTVCEQRLQFGIVQLAALVKAELTREVVYNWSEGYSQYGDSPVACIEDYFAPVNK